jgi:hypothetical protein
MTDRKSLWKSKEAARYFLLPENIETVPGEFSLEDLDGNVISVDLATVIKYETLEAVAEAHLRTAYRSALDETKTSLLRIQKFSQLTGKSNPAQLEQMVRAAFKELSTEEQKPFSMGKEMVEDILSSINRKDANPEEQQEEFKQIFSKVPDLMKYFEGAELEKAMKDPEAWAKAMNEQLFGEQLEAKRKANNERLKKDIQESIARNMRNAGIEPAPIPPKTDEK